MEKDEIIEKKEVKKEDYIEAFIGKSYNRISKKNFSVLAFLFTYFYAAYRKFFLLGYIYVVLAYILFVLAIYYDQVWILLMIVLVRIIIAFFFNKWYLKYVEKKVDKLVKKKNNLSLNEMLDLCKKKGHTNTIVFVITVIIEIFAFIILGVALLEVVYPPTVSDPIEYEKPKIDRNFNYKELTKEATEKDNLFKMTCVNTNDSIGIKKDDVIDCVVRFNKELIDEHYYENYLEYYILDFADDENLALKDYSITNRSEKSHYSYFSNKREGNQIIIENIDDTDPSKIVQIPTGEPSNIVGGRSGSMIAGEKQFTFDASLADTIVHLSFIAQRDISDGLLSINNIKGINVYLCEYDYEKAKCINEKDSDVRTSISISTTCPDSNVEKVCPDYEYKMSINNLVYILNGGIIHNSNNCNVTQEMKNSFIIGGNNNFLDNKDKQDYKLRVALEYADFDFTKGNNYDYNSTSDNVKETIKSKLNWCNLQTISEADVNSVYKKIFGEDVKEFVDVYSCPALTHDTNNHVYYKGGVVCGYETAEFNLFYINHIEEEGDLAYAYVNVGRRVDGVVYNDYNSENIVFEGVDYTFKIDKSNYEKFKEYKYTFHKNSDGGYYFVSVE